MEVRPAATVVVARPGDPGAGGIEVLALRRSASSPFAPGVVVFPGGVVDPGDEELAARLFGRREEAARACAVRELAEEAGLVLTADGLREAPGRRPGDPGFPPPAPRDLPEMVRWVTPEFLPVRFDARFYALAAARGLTPRPDGAEVDLAWWVSPASLLAASGRGELALLWPTLRTLEALASCATVAEAVALRVEPVLPPPPPERQAG